MTRNVFSNCLFVAAAFAAGLSHAANFGLNNTITYCNVQFESCEAGQYSSLSTTNAATISLQGTNGSVSSTADYDSFSATVATADYVQTQTSQATVLQSPYDELTVSGGTGIGNAVAVLSGPMSATSVGPAGGSYATESVRITNADGSVYGGYTLESSAGVLSPSAGLFCSGSQVCSYNAATQQVFVPFQFEYGTQSTLDVTNDLQSEYGGAASLNLALSFIIPAGSTLTAASGTNYISPVPEPAVAWMMLSGLAGLGALRLRRRGSRPALGFKIQASV